MIRVIDQGWRVRVRVSSSM